MLSAAGRVSLWSEGRSLSGDDELLAVADEDATLSGADADGPSAEVVQMFGAVDVRRRTLDGCGRLGIAA